MKNTLKLMVLAFIVMVSTHAFAQKNGGAKKHHGNHKMYGMKGDSAFAKISARLNLTPDQQTKLKEIAKQNRTEMKAVKEANKTASKEDKRAAMMAQRDKNEARINAILNDTQRAEFAKMKAERKAEMKKKHAEMRQKKQGGKPAKNIEKNDKDEPKDDELPDDDLL